MLNAINSYTPQNKPLTAKSVAQKPQNINFKGSKFDDYFSKIADKKSTQNIIIKIANNPTIKKIVDWCAIETPKINKKGEKIIDRNSDKIFNYLMVAYSALLQTNHIINIKKNKQMPEERKETLIVNNALAFVLPTIGAFTIDKSLNRSIDRFQKYAEKTRNNTKFNEKQAGGLKALKSVFIFSMMYKYFATIVTTPMADKVTDFLRDEGLIGKKRKVAEAKK